MRKVLILSTAAVDESMLEKISAADWEVYWAQEAGPARTLLTEHAFEVGLAILFSCESERSIQWLVDLILARRKMQWVMVLSRQCLERKLLSTVIAEHCYDYHTLPIEPQRLVVTQLDRCGYSGPLVQGLLEVAKPVAFFGIGERVPQDVEPAAARRLARMLTRTLQ